MPVDPSAEEIAHRCRTAARELGLGVEALPNGMPVIRRVAPTPLLSIVSGLHGDERSGPLFLMSLLEDWAAGRGAMPEVNFVIVPLVNEAGWQSQGRLWHGLDLNREFRSGTTCATVAALMTLYQGQKPALHWDIHEDDTVAVPYVFEYRDDAPSLAADFAATLECRTEGWFEWDTSSECFLRSIGCARSLTTEVPPTWSLEARRSWLKRAFDFLVCRR